MAFEKGSVCLQRALRLYLQQAPLDVLVAELKVSAAQALEAVGLDAEPSSWTSLGFQQRVAADILDNDVAEEFPPRLEYVSRVTKVLLEAVEAAGEEPSEGLLLARVACASSLREERTVGGAADTAYESFWFPRRRRRRRRCPGTAGDRRSTSAGVAADPTRRTEACVEPGGSEDGVKDGQGEGGGDEQQREEEEAGGAFFPFRVANRDNEVGLRVWEAGRALSEFCLAHSELLEGRSVLELGAGIGMTGMAVAASCGARQVVLTDYAPKVLSNLEHNVEINRKRLWNCGGQTDDSPRPPADVVVRFLDWTDYCGSLGASPSPAVTPAPEENSPGCETIDGASRSRSSGGSSMSSPAPTPACGEGHVGGSSGAPGDGRSASGACLDGLGGSRSSPATAVGVETGDVERGPEDSLGIPEVVLAADVVYDVKYHPALVGVVVETLKRCPEALIVFASTLRNSKTMAAFHRCLQDAGVPWQSVDFPSQSATARSGAMVTPSPAPAPSFRDEGDHAPGARTGCTVAGRGSEPGSRGLWCHPGDLERSPSMSPRRASSLPVEEAKLAISTTIIGTGTGSYGGDGVGGKGKDTARISLAEEGYEAGRSPRSTRRTGSRLGRSTVTLLSALGLLALAPLRGTFRTVSPPWSSSSGPASARGSSSSPQNPSTLQNSAKPAIWPTQANWLPSRVDGVLVAPAAPEEGGGADGAAAGIGGAASARGAQAYRPERAGLREDASLSSSGGSLGEGAARDGRPRCWTDEEGKGRCLPTVFFFGVSKCGTTSLSNWLAEHPRAVLVPAAEGHDFREAHVFDYSPKFWHELTPRARRNLLSPVATPEDTVIDFTPNYSVVGETPLRISDFYGVNGSNEGRLRRNLRFLVVLREPVARTISSWQYKSDPAVSLQPVLHQPNGTVFEGDISPPVHSSSPASAKTGFSTNVGREQSGSHAEGRQLPPQAATETARRKSARRLLRWMSKSSSKVASRSEQSRRRLATATAEQRPLRQAFREGTAVVERLAACVRNATDGGMFGREAIVTFCRSTKGPKQCNGHPPCELCNTHTEPWCNPREYLEDPLYNAHVGKSMYALQLRRWFSVFGRESFKVVFTEDMQADPVKTLTEVLGFLGLDLIDPEGEQGLRSAEAWNAIVGERYNTADGAKKKALDPQVTPELLEEMRAFFAPHNRDLEELLGVPLPKSWSVQV
eukprot:g3540.t1